jgi:hypothetical protein
MRQRIDHLERLVKKLATERRQDTAVVTPESPKCETETQIPTVSSVDMGVSSAGTTAVDGIHSGHGADDWYDVLQEVPFYTHHGCPFYC